MCGETTSTTGRRCQHCGEELKPRSRAKSSQEPHRGVLILILGILGVVCCVPFGIASWVMGSGDLKKMDAGQMDDSGRGLTMAGKVIGIISVVLALISVGFFAIGVIAEMANPH
ncbi:MAG: DUF4190 domain-containing protein [Planctomycetes bacterium]|nr:DUF4190 domain-containing protein [Planctomycetota bacterium]